MQVIGIIAEYNPFHSGHAYHIREIRRRYGPDCAILCVMSGNWVQRGDAAITDKWTRAAMALDGGADLVLELPTPWAISSAESFARGAVSILAETGIVTALSFGSETGELAPLLAAAQCLESPDYSARLRTLLNQGLPFPAARQQAVSSLIGEGASCLASPNNNLGVEYLRALGQMNSPIAAATLQRAGPVHDSPQAGEAFASASHLRQRLLEGLAPAALSPYLSPGDAKALETSGLAALSYGSRGVFARLRGMEAEDFLSLPDCGAGLHHLLASAARETDRLSQLYETVKSRRYTHARIRRLVLWAFLGLRAADRPEAPRYLRVLGMNRQGRALLRLMKEHASLPVLTKPSHVKKLPEPAQRLFFLEARCTGLYDTCRAAFGDGRFTGEFTTNPVLR